MPRLRTSIRSLISPQSERGRWIGFIIAAAVLVAIVHGPSLHVAFLSDDYDWITSAEHNLSTGNYFAPLFHTNGGNFYRPLPALTLTFDRLVANRNVVFYHVDQLVLFLALVISVAWLLSLMTKNRTLAWLTALIFAAYPAHHEVVTWLAGRPDLLAALWIVLSSAMLLKFLTTHRTYWLVLTTLAVCLAYLSKEISFVLPAIHFVLLGIYNWRESRLNWRMSLVAMIPSMLFLVFILIIRGFILTDAIGGYRFGGQDVGLHIPLHAWLAPFTSAAALINLPYLQSIASHNWLVTTVLTHAHGVSVIVLLAVVLIIALLSTNTRARSYLWWALLGLGWAYVTFIPALGISSAIGTDLEGSRLFFTPSIGYSLIIAAVVLMAFGAPARQRWLTVSAVVVIALFACMSWLNIQPWLSASRTVTAITTKLNQHSSTLISSNTTDIIVAGLPSHTYGAYEFWGPHIVRGVVQTVAGRPLHVFIAGNARFADSPFCTLDQNRHIEVLLWDRATSNWERQSTLESTLAHARQQTPPAFPKYYWRPRNLTLHAVTATITSAGSAYVLTPIPVLTGASYRTLHMSMSQIKNATTYGAARATVQWTTTGSSIVQSLSYTTKGKSTFTIPLCEYMNWALSSQITSVAVRPQQTGSFALDTINLSPATP